MNYEIHMARCIELARQAEGKTSPNPMVGAVVLDDKGEVIAEGFHRKAGEAHAEVEALDKAGDAARGGTLFVSLEPCCHHGKTPPCSDRVIASGVSRVVCGMVDPNPKVGGGGISALRNAGIEVVPGIMEQECRYLNRAFLRWIEQRLPWVALKMATTIDGRIADRNRKSKWVTGPDARQLVQELRNIHDCIMIGGATATEDDAQLTVRDIDEGRNPMRAIIDTTLALSPNSRVAQNEDGKTLVFASAVAIEAKKDKFSETIRLVPTPVIQEHLDLPYILKYLAGQRLLNILCEGGGKLASALLPHTDELFWIVAPKVMNDEHSVPALAGTTATDISSLTQFKLRETKQVGQDVLLHYLR